MIGIFNLDCKDAMDLYIDPGSVQCCVTSPPYFGLRDYGHPGQIGLETTPDEYVQKMVDVFRSVRTVLADDGVLWLNLGDSYANDAKWGGSSGGKHVQALHGNTGIGRGKKETGLKPKDLVGIPWRVAFALQADGWYLRQDIIWHKPNPMPESVTDRCTKAHEYIFMFSKSPRYYFDSAAIAEPAVGKNLHDLTGPGYHAPGQSSNRGNRTAKPGKRTYAGFNDRWNNATEDGAPATRNRRSVWTVASRPFKGAHFATFPPDLIEPCILAGSRPGDLVLDPFGGSGTTAGVALKHGRRAVLCELNDEYVAMVPKRAAAIAGTKAVA